MSVQEISRLAVRDMIMEGAERAAIARDRGAVTRSQIRGHMAQSVSARVFAEELDQLCEDGRLWRLRSSSGPRPALYALNPADSLPDAAPDWVPGFPSSGELIGPAWRAIWAALAGGDWLDSRDLGMIGARAGGCREGTARNLLFPAVKAGFIEADARLDESTHRWRTWYRRIPS